MKQSDASTLAENKPRAGNHGAGTPPEPPSTAVRPAPRPGGGLFRQYKPEQGRMVRTGSFLGVGVLVLWGAYYLYQRLEVFEGDQFWNLLVTYGIPLLAAVVAGAVAWLVVYGRRSSGDFIIATEGEMKKVSWSSKREIIGATRVVIFFTVLLAAALFGIDLLFQTFFRWIHVLKV